MKKIKQKKSLIFLGVGLIVVAIVGAAMAYYHDRSVINNVFVVDYSTAEFSETFDSPNNWSTCQTIPKTIVVKNTMDVPIIARVKFEEDWVSANGLGLPLVSSGSGVMMAVMNLTENSGWTLDGTYYYSQPIAPGETSSSVISGVTLNCDANLKIDTRYSNAHYTLSATIQAMQADLAATEWHKYTTVSVKTISEKITALRPSGGGWYEWAFKQASQKADLPGDESDYYIQVDNDSNTPTYLWLDTNTRTAYWYSDADDIYLVNGNGDGFAASYFIYLTDYEGFRNMNTSRITNMGNLLKYARAHTLNGLEKWDVSNVTNMHDLFWSGQNDEYLFDISALSRWDVSNVTDMSYMFGGHPISNVSSLAAWNVRNVDNFYLMFSNTLVDGSLCALVDWPVKKDVRNGSGIFSVREKTSLVDARCLNSWDISYEKSSGWFNPRAFILPSWAH